MTFNSKTTAFLEWLNDQNVEISNKIEIQDKRNLGQGRAVIAIEDIETDEELFRLPRSMFLNPMNSALIKDYPSAKDKLLKLPQWEALILCLAYEWKAKGDESRWKAYFDVLPINDPENYTFDQLIFWSDEEVNDLNPSYIVTRIGKESADSLLSRVRGFILALNISKLQDISQEELHKVAALIMSYSFDVQKEKESDGDDDDEEDEESMEDDNIPVGSSSYVKSMVPLADTLNADTMKHNASLMNHTDCLVLKSLKAIKKGEQVFNTYSEHPNAEILRRYGYVEPDGSAADFGEVSLTLIKDFFAKNTSLSESNIEDIISILCDIQAEEEEEFVLESYDCFASGEVIFELIFIVQLLTVLAGINDETPFNDKNMETKDRAIRRVYKKCYQLLDSGKLTEELKDNLKRILGLRLEEYGPEDGVIVELPLTREAMANVVLQSERKALQECLKGTKLFNSEERKYNFIPDAKLIKNIQKRNIFQEEPSKKQKTE